MIKEIFTPYDTADYLTNDECIRAYLAAVLEDGTDDPTLLALALDNIARARLRHEQSRFWET